jgi:hypothetical protein
MRIAELFLRGALFDGITLASWMSALKVAQ